MIIGLFIILLLYALVFLLANYFYKKGYSQETTRKTVHIGGGLVSLFLPVFFNLWVAVSIGLFFLAFFIFYKKRKILETVYKKNGDNYGVIFFPLGLIMSFILFVPINPIIFQGSVLVLALSDGLAGLLGLKFGQKKYKVTGEKTWLGSLFFFIMTLLILLCIFYIANGSIYYLNILPIMFASLVLTIIEGLFGKGFDNLLLPITSGYIIYYLLSL